jgi:hypothetical protein
VADISGTPGATPDDDAPSPIERLRDHLDEVSEKPDDMQQRLDELGESIETTRRQAEDDDLLPASEGEDSEPAFDGLGIPEGDEQVETPLNDA